MTTVTVMRRDEHDLSSDERLSSCGRPVADAAVRLVDADGNEVPDGEPGELCVRGPLVLRGYLTKPVETAEAFLGGWLNTGDVAVRITDGSTRIVYRGQAKVIIGGLNLYTRSVGAVSQHPTNI